MKNKKKINKKVTQLSQPVTVRTPKDLEDCNLDRLAGWMVA